MVKRDKERKAGALLGAQIRNEVMDWPKRQSLMRVLMATKLGGV